MMLYTYFIELDNIRMSDDFENVDLTSYSFNVRLIFDLVFFKDFDSDLFSCDEMCSQSHFTKRTLSKRSAY